jgi:hypothetical protein
MLRDPCELRGKPASARAEIDNDVVCADSRVPDELLRDAATKEVLATR